MQSTASIQKLLQDGKEVEGGIAGRGTRPLGQFYLGPGGQAVGS